MTSNGLTYVKNAIIAWMLSVMALTSAAAAQNCSRDEWPVRQQDGSYQCVAMDEYGLKQLIQETYAKLALAAQIGVVQKAMLDDGDVLKEVKNAEPEFQFSDFQVGKLADHANEPVTHFMAAPTGEDVLRISTGLQTSSNHMREREENFCEFYAEVEWENGSTPVPGWEKWSLRDLAEVRRINDHIAISHFASFTVTVSLQGKKRTGRETWFFGTDKDGKPMIAVSSPITFGVENLIGRPIYPSVLLDERENRTRPAVMKWLNSVAQDCPGGRRDNCFDPLTGKAGISWQDIERGATPRYEETCTTAFQ